jgi:hypothetical protein
MGTTHLVAGVCAERGDVVAALGPLDLDDVRAEVEAEAGAVTVNESSRPGETAEEVREEIFHILEELGWED